jgi:hypothetical protein
VHQADSEFECQRLVGIFRRNCVRVREQAQHQAVEAVREVSRRDRPFILDPDAAFGTRRAAQHRIRCGGKRRREIRVLLEQRFVLAADLREAMVVRALTVLRRAFALRDDRSERRQHGLQADDLFDARQSRIRRRQLQRGVAAERDLLAMRLDEAGQAVAEDLVEFTDARVVHRHRRQARTVGAAQVGALGSKDGTVRLVRAGRAFQMYKMLQRRGVERRQPDDDTGRQVARIEWKIRAPEPWRAAERGGDVPYRDQVTHLLRRDGNDRCAPTLHGLELRRSQSFVRAGLQRKRRVQIGAHQAVFELRGLAQRVKQVLAARGRFEIAGHAGTVSGCCPHSLERIRENLLIPDSC